MDPETGEISDGVEEPAKKINTSPQWEWGDVPPPPATGKRLIDDIPPEKYWRSRWNLVRDERDRAKYVKELQDSVKRGKCPAEVWNLLDQEFNLLAKQPK